tara:strand:- start:2534 stop:2800 length:267 start_codon:yes stop_codon:yes gene_type:complete
MNKKSFRRKSQSQRKSRSRRQRKIIQKGGNFFNTLTSTITNKFNELKTKAITNFNSTKTKMASYKNNLCGCNKSLIGGRKKTRKLRRH